MPWQETSRMLERRQFIESWLRTGDVLAFCDAPDKSPTSSILKLGAGRWAQVAGGHSAFGVRRSAFGCPDS